MSTTPLNETLTSALQKLKAIDPPSTTWLLGGSCALLLQRVALDKEPQDIDIYANEEDAIRLQEQWEQWSMDQSEWNETSMYRSLLSHYQIGAATVELVGEFHVRTSWCSYHTTVRDGLDQHAILWKEEGMEIRLMPLSHELVFNLLREREDRFLPIANAMEAEPEKHQRAIAYVLGCCEPVETIKDRLHELIPGCMKGLAR